LECLKTVLVKRGLLETAVLEEYPRICLYIEELVTFGLQDQIDVNKIEDFVNMRFMPASNKKSK